MAKKMLYNIIKNGVKIRGKKTLAEVIEITGVKCQSVYVHAVNEKPVIRDGVKYVISFDGEYKGEKEQLMEEFDDVCRKLRESGVDLSKIRLVCSGVSTNGK